MVADNRPSTGDVLAAGDTQQPRWLRRNAVPLPGATTMGIAVIAPGCRHGLRPADRRRLRRRRGPVRLPTGDHRSGLRRMNHQRTRPEVHQRGLVLHLQHQGTEPGSRVHLRLATAARLRHVLPAEHAGLQLHLQLNPVRARRDLRPVVGVHHRGDSAHRGPVGTSLTLRMAERHRPHR